LAVNVRRQEIKQSRHGAIKNRSKNVEGDTKLLIDIMIYIGKVPLEHRGSWMRIRDRMVTTPQCQKGLSSLSIALNLELKLKSY
jgi:hypothetical protein